MTDTRLLAQLRTTARLQRERTEAATKLNEARSAYVRDNNTIIEAEAAARQAHQESEALLRELAVAIYVADPSTKQLAPGVEIQLKTVAAYSMERALEWAYGHEEHKWAIVPEALDVPAFESFAKSTKQPLSFVELLEDTSTKLAGNLTVAMEKAGVALEADPVLVIGSAGDLELSSGPGEEPSRPALIGRLESEPAAQE